MNYQQSLFQNILKRKLSQETDTIFFAAIELQLCRTLFLLAGPEKYRLITEREV
jgi:hypothetical protein